MLFHSLEFMFGFLPICFAGFALLHRYCSHRAALAWLAVASLVFYGQWSWQHALLLAASVTANFAICQAMIALDARARARRLVFFLGIAANLGVLGYLKYANFLIDNVNALASSDYSHIQVLIPVGVSFFTFIQIGFLVEVYNRQVKQLRFLDYFLFGSFFSYVTAGPLVLQRDMLPQLDDDRQSPLDPMRIAVALTVFGIGLFKKLTLADSVAPFADAVFNGVADGSVPTMSLAWIGALAYTLQLYFDFSGYCDMALGIGLLFNFRLPFNFNSPLKATSITDFWRRWHMTMTRFFTSYIYAPLAVGNSRKALLGRYGPVRSFATTVAVPVMLTFLLAGIWHGAGWTFVIFGLIHGVAMAANHAWRRARLAVLPEGLSWFLTMLVVIAGLVVFRSPDVPTALGMLQAMVSFDLIGSGWAVAGNAALVDYANAVAIVSLLFAAALMLPNTQQVMFKHNISADPADYDDLALSRWFEWRPSAGWALGCAVVMTLGLSLASADSTFIYYQF